MRSSFGPPRSVRRWTRYSKYWPPLYAQWICGTCVNGPAFPLCPPYARVKGSYAPRRLDITARTPKGLVHHGPAEDVPEGYRHFCRDARINALTAAGETIAALMETGQFGIFDNDRAESKDPKGRVCHDYDRA
jgi:hypothetical protein